MTEHLLEIGQILLDRYEVESYLAAGGMQQVFRARDLSFDRLVALKIPQSDSAERRFDRSARMSARISHPNVAKTLDYFEQDGKSFLIEELVDGVDLSKFLESYDPLDPHLGAHVLHHLARAVAASHHVDVIHRDLKPGNILVSRDPAATIVKVTDFGIAKMAEEELSDALVGGEDSITASKTALGALPYMAPEMIEDSKKAKTPVDIWAIGALAYRMFSGIPPYGFGLKAVTAIMTGGAPSRPAIWDANSQFEPLLTELWSIITDCLDRVPSKRPTADQLVERCAELGYLNAARLTGIISNYPIRQWNYGFISPHGAGEDVFFHSQSFFGMEKPVEGMHVAFAAFPGSPRARAYPVVQIKPQELVQEE